LPERGTALEIGCGSGGMVATLARHFEAVAGIDINMVDLILAKKLAEEQELTNVTLACACAEALPFQDGSFDYIEALDVIEHVSSQATVLTEANRVLGPGGVFWFTSPNRFYLYGPERHVMLWGVGFMPRRWQNAYVKLRKGVPYQGKRLLSRAELIRLLREAGVESYTLIEPDPIVKLTRSPRSRRGRIVRDHAPWLVSLVNRSAPQFGSEHRVVVSK
jgi:ubiquinone/menaquinone biosynthesis C-methylase UbiE